MAHLKLSLRSMSLTNIPAVFSYSGIMGSKILIIATRSLFIHNVVFYSNTTRWCQAKICLLSLWKRQRLRSTWAILKCCLQKLEILYALGCKQQRHPSDDQIDGSGVQADLPFVLFHMAPLINCLFATAYSEVQEVGR